MSTVTQIRPTGERQMATSLDKIAPDHRQRYEWVAAKMPEGSKILDAGSGNGYGSYILAKAKVW